MIELVWTLPLTMFPPLRPTVESTGVVLVVDQDDGDVDGAGGALFRVDPVAEQRTV